MTKGHERLKSFWRGVCAGCVRDLRARIKRGEFADWKAVEAAGLCREPRPTDSANRKSRRTSELAERNAKLRKHLIKARHFMQIMGLWDSDLDQLVRVRDELVGVG